MAEHPSPSYRGLVASAVASGIVTVLVPPARIPARVRRSVHAGLGLAAAGATAWTLGRTAASEPGQPDDDSRPAAPHPFPLRTRLAISTVVGALAAASSAAGMGLDAVAERALVRRGVPHPRVWMGVAAAALSAATAWADTRREGARGAHEARAATPG